MQYRYIIILLKAKPREQKNRGRSGRGQPLSLYGTLAALLPSPDDWWGDCRVEENCLLPPDCGRKLMTALLPPDWGFLRKIVDGALQDDIIHLNKVLPCM